MSSDHGRRTVAVIARLWRVRIHPERSADYERFVARHSRPMFRSLPGLVQVLFLARGDERIALSVWKAPSFVDDLAGNDDYQRTSQDLGASGILADEPTLEVFEVAASDVADVPPDWLVPRTGR